jgi:hypothetical protein
MRLGFLVFLLAFWQACGSSESTSELAEIEFHRPSYPHHPDAVLTPGSLCKHATEWRYGERIPYCKRSVSSQTKRIVIHNYDVKLGHSIGRMDRGDFKIDHFIPLCMGGSNEESNLWPQHKSIFAITDQLESDLCQMMAIGVIQQREAIATLKRAKTQLAETARIAWEVRSRCLAARQ